MNRIEYRLFAAFFAVAIGFAPIASAAAAGAKVPNEAIPTRPSAAKLPLLGHVVVTPSPTQLAKIRLERRMTSLESRTHAAGPTGNGHVATIGAL